MTLSIRKIALAIAFSPTAEAMLAETQRLVDSLRAELLLIHVGRKTRELHLRLDALLEKCGIDTRDTKITWEGGDPADTILRTCSSQGVDLLVTGALRKENLVQHYVGTIARKVLRSAPCSVLTIVDPSTSPAHYKNIVVNAEDSPFISEAVSLGCHMGKMSQSAWIHIVRELKLYGLTMAASDQYTEDEYQGVRQNLVRQEIEKVEELLQRIPHGGLKVNIKVVSGKSGFELSRFAERKRADVLIVGAPANRFNFFDRVFPHDLEYILANLPCNLLVVQERKEVVSG